MDKEQIKEYFEKYIETYPAYKRDKLFTGLSSYLVDYYYDDLYNKVPDELKMLYEDQELQSNVYDKFLIAIGVPKQVINKLSFNEKIIFLKSLSDFRRYKGTIDFVRKIGKSFDDTFNVYELYIDYDHVSSAWVFKPVIIYKDTDLKEVRDKIPYQEVYDELPNFLIQEEKLENLRQNSDVTLPIKSNILFLDEQIVTDISLMRNLIISTFVKDYKDNYVNIYFSDSQHSLKIETIYYAWYYLACRYYNTPWLKVPGSTYMLQFDDFRNPFTVYDLKDLMSEYESLDTNQEVDLFYKNNLEPFAQFVQSENMAVEDLGDRLRNLNDAFSDYLEQRIAESVDEQKEINIVINEIYNSLIYYRDTYGVGIGASANDPFLEYFDYFLESLPQLTIDPKDTTSYILIYNFKPYHTELLSNVSNVLTYNDKFNSVMLSDSKWFHFEMIKYELLGLIDERYIQLELNKQSDIKLVSNYETINMSLRYADNLEEQIGDVARDMLLLEYIAFTVEQKGTSVLAISDVKKSIDMLKDSSSSLNYQSLFKVLDSITRQEDLGISIDFMIVALAKHISNLEVKDEFKTMPAKRMVGNVPVVSFIDSNWMSMSNLYLYELIEEPKVLLALPTHGDVFELDEQFEVILQQP
jgi:hypothetical protein